MIELLVVIAIIGILAALLLPVLAQVKGKARNAACLSNLRQLTICIELYAIDNDDALPPNNFVYDISTHMPLILGESWCTNIAPYDTNVEGITLAKLYRYNEQRDIYRCPGDRSTVETFGGASLGIPRLRSYNMSQSINGDSSFSFFYADLPCFRKMAQVMNPGPSQCFALIEVHEDEITDTEFGIPVSGMAPWYEQGYWWDIPANRHDQGCNFSFLDGHVEHWKWRVPKAPLFPRGYAQWVPPEEMPDYNRMQSGFRQSKD